MIDFLLLSDIARHCQGELIGKDGGVNSVSTDSRSISSGQLFVALKGENFDGHKYLKQAVDQGATSVLVDTDSGFTNQFMASEEANTVSVIKVSNTLKALGNIGWLNRANFNGPVVGITGSAGKTTTKEMIAAILSLDGNTLYTQGNFNNEVGVPKTLLSIDASHRYAVIEMGAARVGDIAYLGQFVQPDISVLTNAAEAHIQGFGSLDAVAQGKSEIYSSLKPSGIGILNIDDVYSSRWRSVITDAGADLVSVSLHDKNADVYASSIQETALGSSFVLNIKGKTKKVELSIPGVYNIQNALMAAAVAERLGIDCSDIAAGLSNCCGIAGRMQKTVMNGLTVLDDTYNANPKAMKAALSVLSSQESHNVAVLGCMGELGENSDAFHLDVLESAKQAGIETIYCFGEFWPEVDKYSNVTVYKNKNALTEKLLSQLSQLINENKLITVLVKGSRSMKMETFVELLTRTYQFKKVGAN